MAACLKLTYDTFDTQTDLQSAWRIRPEAYAGPSHMRLAQEPEDRPAEAVRIDHSLDCHRRPRVNISVSTIDNECIQASSPSPLIVGERVAIKLGGRSAFSRTSTMLARVERCWRMGDEFAITFGFEPLSAA
jgi:hypothetical protein